MNPSSTATQDHEHGSILDDVSSSHIYPTTPIPNGIFARPIESFASIPKEAPEQARNRMTYASFGREGITATASAYGHLLQITRYFGNKPSGFFCVDLPHISNPFYVKTRMENLQSSSKDFTKGMRLLFHDAKESKSWIPDGEIPAMSFIQDRWPSFITHTPIFDLKIQYYIFDNTVYQTYIFTLKDKLSLPQLVPVLAISVKLLLRNLNFMEDNDENKREGSHFNYGYREWNDGHSIMRKHEIRSSGQAGRDVVALSISPFLNGRRQKITLAEHGGVDGYCTIQPDAQALNDLKNDRKLEVTLAYTLELSSSNSLDDMLQPVYSAYYSSFQKIIGTPLATIPFTQDEHLNFTIRRNLEHILSVCCIPIRKLLRDVPPAHGSSANHIHTREVPPPLIALTCGDISGHRVEPSASFYAFQFILGLLEYFKNARQNCACASENRSLCKKYGCGMYSRVRDACLGHLKWICHCYAQREMGPVRHSIPSFWASGKAISDWENKFGLSQSPLTTIIFQVIKAGSFCQTIADEDLRRDIAADFKDIIRHFILGLHRNKKRSEYVFPRFREEMPQTFYTSDHAKFWWAIKSAEVILGSNSYLNPSSSMKIAKSEISYSSNDIQRSIHKNFIAENPDAASTLTTVSRSLSKNEYLLGIDDTVLFYTMDNGLFDKPKAIQDESDIWGSKIDAWENTVNYQALSTEVGHDAARSRPLQLALATIISANNKCIGSQSAEDTYKDAKSVLLSSTSPNGLFPGQLDKDYQPTLFDRQSARDLFWHTTFEIPYILWKYRAPVFTNKGVVTQSLKKSLHKIAQRMEKILDHQDAMARAPRSLVYESNIMEISDEWLYHEPSFFNGPHNLSDAAMRNFCKTHDALYGSVIQKAIENKLNDQDNISIPIDRTVEEGYIIDVPKKDQVEDATGRYWHLEFVQTKNVKHIIKRERTSTSAKKRFLYFRPLTLATALACYIASSEQEAISAYFDRHASYSRYFLGETTAALNKWVTELHLPFYRITKKNLSVPMHANLPNVITLPGEGSEENLHWISRTTMSFRVDGDIFDRFWTCHFIEYNQWKMNKEGGIASDIIKIANKKIGASQGGPWRQRKVLELVLLDMMLDEMLDAAKQILLDVQGRVEKHLKLATRQQDGDETALISAISDRFNLIDKLDNNTFQHLSHLWNDLRRILQVIKDELYENLKTIQLWTDRGKEQGRDKPRWTANDERKYRRAIFKLQESNGQKIHELYRFITTITYFDTALTKKIENVRNERDYRGNNDIRLFTYVTVVFVPLSFGTSLYSMSGSPSPQTIVHMVITAAVALLVTTFALVNANLLDKGLRPIFNGASRISESVAKPAYHGIFISVHWITKLLYDKLVDPVFYLLARYLFIPLFYKLKRSEFLLPEAIEDIVGLIKRLKPVAKAYKNWKQKEEAEAIESEMQNRVNIQELFRQSDSSMES